MIDMRSDFLARRTPAMLEAAAAAEGEFHFGLREDPHQIALERRVAELVGHEDALVFPTCTMANLTAMLVLGRPGTRVLTPADAHVFTSEGGGAAAFGGLLLTPLDAAGAAPPLDEWRRAAAGGDAQRPAASLLVLENTHNRAGGEPVSAEYTAELLALARRVGVRAHLDGSRLLNAAVALGVAPAELARGFDTVSISLNKGLGSPIAAALAGSKALIDEALVVRQRLGGGIRPTGPAAAATLAALYDLSAIAESHRHAARLARGLAGIEGLRVDAGGTLTNIVVAEVVREGLTAPVLRDHLAVHGLLTTPFDARRLRFVTCRGIGAREVAEAVTITARTLDEMAQARAATHPSGETHASGGTHASAATHRSAAAQGPAATHASGTTPSHRRSGT